MGHPRNVCCNKTGPRIVAGRSGAAYVLACVTLVVGLVVALAMLRMVDGGIKAEMSRSGKGAAADMAEAGTAYATWLTTHPALTLPYSEDVTLTNGTFHIDMVDDSARRPGAIIVTSTGQCRSQKHIIKRCIIWHDVALPFDYAMCLNSSLSTGSPIMCVDPSAGVFINGNVNLSSTENNITAGVWATGSIAGKGHISPRHSHETAVTFPSIDHERYRAAAADVYPAGIVFRGIDSPTPRLIYVDGDANVRAGRYTGMTTIVAAGRITVGGVVDVPSGSNLLALVCNTQITIRNTVPSLNAILYVSNGNDAPISLRRSDFSITGCVCADRISLPAHGSLTVRSNPNLTRSAMAQMKLPGAF